MEGESMSEWKEVRLGDITDIIGDGIHGTPVYDENGEYFFINGSNLYKGKIIINNDTKKIGYEEYLKHKKVLNKNTILLSINGTIGNIALYNGEKCILGKSACYININHLFDKFFIFYILSSHKFLKEITFKANGTTIKNVSLKQIRDYTFYIPSSYEKQKEISGILSSLDAKIETNNKLNEKLEEMAQAIFKSWFVDFEPFKDKPFHETELGMIPEGWEVKNIDHLYDIKYGNNLSTSEIKKSGQYPVYGANGVIGYYDVSNCNDYSVLITSRGNGSGDVYRTHSSKSYVTNNSFIVKPKSNYSWIELSYIYYSFLNINFKSYTNGSAQPQLTNKSIHNIDILLPTKKEIQNFCNLTMPIVYNIELLMRENDRLASLRDTLLPRLMSGELIV